MFLRNNINPEVSYPITDLTGCVVRVCKNVFSDKEIEDIHEISTWFTPIQSTVGGDEGKEIQKLDVRSSKATFLQPNPRTEWLYKKLTEFIHFTNGTFFRFNIGFIESLQYTVYDEGDFYDYHTDTFDNNYNVFMEQRKLSISIQLSDESEYEGGDLEFYALNEPPKAPRGKGTAIIFPSFLHHRVTPVTKGTRRSLVIWVTGPDFV